jgi:hypothetical protein
MNIGKYDDVIYVIPPTGPGKENWRYYKVQRDNTRDDGIRYILSRPDLGVAYPGYSINAMNGLECAGYSMCSNEKEFLAWYLKHGN